MHIKSVIISSLLVWLLGLIAYSVSHFIPIMDDSELQANWVLAIAVIPLAGLGAHLYYRKGHQTDGFKLGIAMFLVAMLLDALITVPVFVIPDGGNHLSFFTDLGFWIIALEYIGVVVVYWKFGRRRLV